MYMHLVKHPKTAVVSCNRVEIILIGTHRGHTDRSRARIVVHMSSVVSTRHAYASAGGASCCTLLQRFSLEDPGYARKRQSPHLFEATPLSVKTRTNLRGVLGPTNDDLQLLGNIVKRGDRMGTSGFRAI